MTKIQNNLNLIGRIALDIIPASLFLALSLLVTFGSLFAYMAAFIMLFTHQQILVLFLALSALKITFQDDRVIALPKWWRVTALVLAAGVLAFNQEWVILALIFAPFALSKIFAWAVNLYQTKHPEAVA